jgi:putative transcriptional regulator
MRNSLPEHREREGLSQADLAAAVGVSRQTINAIERERYDPSLELAFKLAARFDRPIEALFDPDLDGCGDDDGGDADDV